LAIKDRTNARHDREEFMTLSRSVAAAGLALALGAAGPAFADVTIHLLHVSQTNDPEWKAIADAYNKSHPGTTVVVDYLENEAFKAKLPTLLQSADKPAIIYSWGGGVMRAQIDAGYLRDISSAKADLDKTTYPAGLAAFTVDGKLYGVPEEFSEVSIFYNKGLFKKADLDPASMGTWDGFLAGVKKLKAAGITPIIVGAGEKWPMHFYWSYLLMRIGGQDVLSNAEAGKDGGFKGPAFVEAGKDLKDLSDLQPYQDGWLSTLFPASTGLFGDGKGAMTLMGNWLLGMQGPNATDGKGIPPDQLGMMPFPTVAGGKGKATDTFGGINGFLVTKDAPDQAIDFLKYFETVAAQTGAAEKGLYVPAVIGTDTLIKDPFVSQVAKDIGNSTWHQNFLDQDLGPSVGRVVNDESVAIASGQAPPADAAAAIQDAWDTK
jgi:raffinose/stachyose/melibiose transport system substrate-binding protein